MADQIEKLDAKEKVDLQKSILTAFLSYGPVLSRPVILHDIDQAGKKHELKASLAGAFSKAGTKVVKVDDLMKNFDQISTSQFGVLGELTNRYELQELTKKGLPSVDGLYIRPDASGKPVAYVSSEFVEKVLVNAVDAGMADGHEDAAKRTGVTLLEAIQKSPDQSAAVRAAAPKPKI